MTTTPILVLVESRSDEFIVSNLVRRAGLPVERFRVVSGEGREILRLARRLQGLGPQVVLMDLDDRSLPDAEASARAQLGESYDGEVFCAVPEIEAWLLADDQLLRRRFVDDPEATALLERLPLPEELPRPRQFLRDLFGAGAGRPEFLDAFIGEMDLGRACGRSPSLRRFLEGLARLAGVSLDVTVEALSRSLHRDVLSGLLSELPADAVVWRAVSGDTYTAAELRAQVEEGTEMGRLYAADLLRVSRDLLRRTALRKTA